MPRTLISKLLRPRSSGPPSLKLSGVSRTLPITWSTLRSRRSSPVRASIIAKTTEALTSRPAQSKPTLCRSASCLTHPIARVPTPSSCAPPWPANSSLLAPTQSLLNSTRAALTRAPGLTHFRAGTPVGQGWKPPALPSLGMPAGPSYCGTAELAVPEAEPRQLAKSDSAAAG
jgi:hypothetical protein